MIGVVPDRSPYMLVMRCSESAAFGWSPSLLGPVKNKRIDKSISKMILTAISFINVIEILICSTSHALFKS